MIENAFVEVRFQREPALDEGVDREGNSPFDDERRDLDTEVGVAEQARKESAREERSRVVGAQVKMLEQMVAKTPRPDQHAIHVEDDVPDAHALHR